MAELKEQDTNYLTEVLGHPVSTSTLLAAVSAGAVLSIMAGFGPAAIPVVLWAGAQSVAALFLPGSPVFREWVDRRKRAERREIRRKDLTQTIAERLARLRAIKNPSSAEAALRSEVVDYGIQYERMRERLASITRMASTHAVAMSPYDLEKLDDATVDFLRLVHARLILHERIESYDERDLQAQLRALDRQLEAAENPLEQRKLKQAMAEVQKVVDRRRLFPAQDAANRAQLMSMADAFEELHNHLSTEGGGADVSHYLHEATERLHVEEQMEAAVEAEMDEIAQKTRARAASQASGRSRGASEGP